MGHVHAWEEPKLVLVVNSRDVTDRKHTEEQIRKLSRTVAQSTSTVVITDSRGNIEFINPKFTEVTGYRANEVIGPDVPRPQVGLHRPSSPRALGDRRQGWGVEGRAVQPQEERRPLLGVGHDERRGADPDGRITHFLAIKNDITAHKREQACTELLHQVQLKILDGQDVNAIMGYICGRLAEIFGLGLVWWGAKRRTTAPSASPRTAGPSTISSRRGSRQRWDDDEYSGRGPSGACDPERSGSRSRIGMTRTAEQFRDWAHQAGHRNTMVIPLSCKGKVVGSLSVNSVRRTPSTTRSVVNSARSRLG